MSQPSSIRSLWYRWKSMRLPWRKKRLIGQDLSGTTFWELNNENLPSRPRRLAHYPQQTHPGDVVLTPAWIQWLRHTRPSAPSIQEQQLEVLRQAQLKQLAAAADQRWAEKPSYLDRPADTAQLPPDVLQPMDKGGYGKDVDYAKMGVGDGTMANGRVERADGADCESTVRGQERDVNDSKPKSTSRGFLGGPAEEKKNPWTKHRAGSSEQWQPAAWTPPKAER